MAHLTGLIAWENYSHKYACHLGHGATPRGEIATISRRRRIISGIMDERQKVPPAPSKRANHSSRHISFVPLQSWVKAAVRCGFPIYPVLKEIGLSINESSPSGITISVDQSKVLVVACSERSRGEHFPFVFGECFSIDAVPEVDNFFSTSSTLREGIRVFDWIRQLVSPTLGVILYESGGIAQLRILMDRLATRSPATVYFTEAVITWILRETRSVLGGQYATKLLFRHPAPPYWKKYQVFFGIEVKFGQPHDAIELPRELLNRKLNGALPELHKQAESRLKRKVAQLPSRTSTAGQLERLFSFHQSLFSQGMEAAADLLGMTVRTLQRRLQAEDQNFGDLQARSRYRLAQSMLRETSLNLEAISEKLGFSDRRTFTRAFEKWSGQSPSEYRRACIGPSN
jgi:AraC-like DNA-binding protein